MNIQLQPQPRLKALGLFFLTRQAAISIFIVVIGALSACGIFWLLVFKAIPVPPIVVTPQSRLNATGLDTVDKTLLEAAQQTTLPVSKNPFTPFIEPTSTP